MSGLAILLVLLAGLALGATSIGGIVVVPTLTVADRVAVPEAIAAANLGFLLPAIAAFVASRTSPDMARLRLAPLGLGAIAGAALGALTLGALPATAVRLVVAALAVLSGLMALLRPHAAASAQAARRLDRPSVQLALGLVVGCGSAWSGTGGPVLLTPLLLALHAPTVSAIAMAQYIQLPIAGAATAANLASGQLHWRLGLLVGAVLTVGWVAGWLGARRLPLAVVRRLLAAGLIGVGLWYGWQTLKGAMT